jgi:hypothetical protein
MGEFLDEEVYRLCARMRDMPIAEARKMWYGLILEAKEHPQETRRSILLTRNALLATELRISKVPIWGQTKPLEGLE